MVYKLSDVKVKYQELLNLSKLIINISDSINNLEYELNLAKYFLNNSIKRANVFYVLEENNEFIGAMLAYIPNFCLIENNLNNYKFASTSNTTLFKKLLITDFSEKELEILMHEIFLEKQYFENVWVKTLIQNDSSEILFFSIDSQYQSKGYSKKLLNAFLEDSKNNNIRKYHLFTTSNCDYKYYEKLGMKCKSQTKVSNDFSLLVYEKDI